MTSCASTRAKRLLLSAAAAFALCTAAEAQAPPKVLSSKDAAAYAQAFAAVRQGRFQVLDDLKRKVRDLSLLGRLTYLKLMHPDYRADYDELKRWLSRFGDQPDADKVYALARKRRPGAGLEPSAEGAGLEPTQRAALKSDDGLKRPQQTADPAMLAAKTAFFETQDMGLALTLANRAGDRWIAGLAAFRLGRYDMAAERFAALARDPTRSTWVRSAAAFWSARALIAAGRPEAAPEFLKLAASSPYTFYGLIAERELGLDPAVTADGVDMGPDARAAAAADLSGTAARGQSASAMPSRALSRFLKADKRARRAAALAQIGQSSDAYAELRAALFGAGSDAARAKWRGLAGDLGLSLAAASAPDPKTVFDVASFQHPSLQPLGGYTQDPALVFAIVRQESGFNPNAASSAGALGLMQVTPATGALAAGLEAKAMDPSLLLDPEVNLRLGQDALGRLLEESDGDLVKTIAAYNAGPRAVGRWLASMPQADSLLMLESLPAAETRDYVQRVMAGYWIYRRLFNQPAGSLDAAAGGARVLLAASDAASPATAALLAPGVSQTVQSDPAAAVAAPP